ncbi:MAG TPA: hypothetical protein VF517_11415 [Thermoleophilaceae bacterium]|jgi:hypothetical protein
MSTPPPARLEVNGLMLSGFTELGFGAMTGWIYALALEEPDRARAIGIKSVDRVRQWHLDLIALGGLSVLVGTALPSLPRRVSVPLAVGCWTNAMSFGVLMVKPDLTENMVYRAAITGSFAITSAGFVGAAREAWSRRRRPPAPPATISGGGNGALDGGR